MKNIYLILMTMILCIKVLNAQSIERTIIAAGGQSNTKVSYTIGQPFAHGKGILNITAGFHQPGIAIDNNPVLGTRDISTQLSVYPNPAIRYVNIKGGSLITESSQVDVFNVEGKTMNIPITYTDGVQIDFDNQVAGIYFLVITNPHQQSIAKFKIVKSK